MIRANARSRLHALDLQVAIAALAGTDAARRREIERRVEHEGPDTVLDDPRLAPRLLAMRTLLVPSAPLFIYAMMRQYLLEAGFDDADLADYLAALVLDFGQRDRAWRIDTHDDATHGYLVDLLADLANSDGARRFQVMAHLGNYALWLAGLFPDRIAARQVRRGGPDVEYYDTVGRRGFAMASEHTLAAQAGLEHVFGTAAERFPALRGALNRFSDRVLFPDAWTRDRVLREVSEG